MARASFYDNRVKTKFACPCPERGLLHLCERGGFVRRDSCVLGNPHHGEHLLEVWCQAEDANSAMTCRPLLYQHLDDDRNAGRVNVVDAAEVKKHLFDRADAMV